MAAILNKQWMSQKKPEQTSICFKQYKNMMKEEIINNFALMNSMWHCHDPENKLPTPPPKYNQMKTWARKLNKPSFHHFF